jgi:hypothetical protein
MDNLFEKQDLEKTIKRVNSLTASSKPKWGKMSVAQMLAHCSVAYEMVYEPNKYPKPAGFKKFILKLFVKGIVVSEKGYKPNGRTAPQFLITTEKEFEKEKERFISFLNKTFELGTDHFEGKESHSFGLLTQNEWNNSFAKHIDHHLKQFGV